MFELMERSTKESEKQRKCMEKECVYEVMKNVILENMLMIKHGIGVFVWEDGRRYEVFWANGK